MPRAHVRRRFALFSLVAARLMALVVGGRRGASACAAASVTAQPVEEPLVTPAGSQASAAYRTAFADRTAVEAPASEADYQNPRMGDHLERDVQVYDGVHINMDDPSLVLVAHRVQASVRTPIDAARKPCAGSPGRRWLTRLLVANLGGIWKVSDLMMMEPGSC